MKYEVEYTLKTLKAPSLIEPKQTQKIIEKITFYKNQINPLLHAKKLTNSKVGTYRVQIGNDRAIFDTDKQGKMMILSILEIKHRKDIYK